MALTTAFGIPYPQLSDDVDVSDDFRLMAEKLQDILANPTCKLILPAAFGVANNNNTVTLPFGVGSEAIKTDASMHSTTVNNTRIIPNKPGFYLFSVMVTFAPNTTGFRTCSIGKNGVRQGPENGIYNSAALPVGANATLPMAHTILQMNGTTDYAECFAFQNSGGALNVVGDGTTTNTGNTTFLCARVRPSS